MLKTIKYIIYVTLAAASAIFIAISGTILYITPKLPEVEILSDIKLQTPLRVYTNNGLLISEFGDKKRTPVTMNEIPEQLKEAFLSAEDADFYSHNGISIKGLSRAFYEAVTQSNVQTGGSTITQQVAKNYFLTPERTVIRKAREMLLALQMEKTLTKDKILELYLNKIFLGNRSYGVAAAAQVYYGKQLDELTLAQSAMIAGLPKAPSSSNPVRNPEKALGRRNWILLRMLTLGHISQDQYDMAISEHLSAKKHGVEIEAYAPYIAEMARQRLASLLGEDAINDGYSIYTTIDPAMQSAADKAVKTGLEAYDARHGYRPPTARLDNISGKTIEERLKKEQRIGHVQPAIVIAVNDTNAYIQLQDNRQVEILWDNGLSTARPYINENQRGKIPKNTADILSVGDLVRVTENDGQWHLSQIPDIEGALVALDPYNGAIRALVGGYDFYKSKFNRATQARRQMGSNMKPFIYASAISKSLTAASIINDAPIVFHDNNLENTWRPTNDGGRFLGPTRLRVGLYRSRNLISIRVLKQVGINYARNYATRFGFKKKELPHDLSLALGTASFPPLQTARAYAVFANGGFLIEPYLIERITDSENNAVYESNPAIACEACMENTGVENSSDQLISNLAARDIVTDSLNYTAKNTYRYAKRVISKQDAFIVDSILRDVTQKGTGWRAGKALKRTDISSKTGTTNGPTDAWFSGYHPKLVAVSWVGFDDNSDLGNREYGGTAALPIWVDFMRPALKGFPHVPLKAPEGVVSVLIDKTTGTRASPGQPNTMFEYFRESRIPQLENAKPLDTDVNWEDIFN